MGFRGMFEEKISWLKIGKILSEIYSSESGYRVCFRSRFVELLEGATQLSSNSTNSFFFASFFFVLVEGWFIWKRS